MKTARRRPGTLARGWLMPAQVRSARSAERPFRYLARAAFCALQKVHLLGCGGQFGAEIRMGDADQGLSTLLRRLAAQLRDAVLGDHVVDVVLAGGHVSARREGLV